MKIILLTDIPKLGRKYETKDVSDGHALNFLIPKGQALAATPDAIKRIGVEKAKREGEMKVQEDLLAANLKSLEGLTIAISEKANDKGHLFAGLHATEISAALKREARVDIDPSFLVLSQPIKEIGEHTIEVKAGGKSARFKLTIKAG
jgi:large subunit ribosomal protein L9